MVIDPARPAQLAPILGRAYGLTAREQEVAALIAQGFGTSEITPELCISAHTVQDHLKAVVDKVGVRGRQQLTDALIGVAHTPDAAATHQTGAAARS